MADFEICTLASGSKGNCTYIKYKNTSLVIDQGLTVKELSVRASLRGIDLSRLNAIIVTHEHSDHTKGVNQLSQQFSIPVYMPQTCYDSIRKRLETMPYFVQNDAFESGFCVGDIFVTPFRVPHDANYTVGYRLSDGKTDIAVATDLGFVSDNTLSKLSGCKAVILESNHDKLMLAKGKYPDRLKARIASKNGHLSNDDCADVIPNLVASGATRLLLAHLSEDNNTPELAFETAKNALLKKGIKEGEDVIIDIATQFKPSDLIKL